MKNAMRVVTWHARACADETDKPQTSYLNECIGTPKDMYQVPFRCGRSGGSGGGSGRERWRRLARGARGGCVGCRADAQEDARRACSSRRRLTTRLSSAVSS